MSEYLFSVEPINFEKISPLIKKVDELDKEWEKHIDDEDKEERLKLIRLQDETKDKIEQILLDAGERNEPLITIEDELNEGRIVINFKRYFARQDHSMINIRQGPLDPEAVKEYWKKLTNFIENEDGKKKVIQYCIETEDYDYTNDQIESIFNKWISILNHAAENGNWFYHHVNLE